MIGGVLHASSCCDQRRQGTTTKLLIVYDASAKASGPSLNDCLYTRPKIQSKNLEHHSLISNTLSGLGC